MYSSEGREIGYRLSGSFKCFLQVQHADCRRCFGERRVTGFASLRANLNGYHVMDMVPRIFIAGLISGRA